MSRRHRIHADSVFSIIAIVRDAPTFSRLLDRHNRGPSRVATLLNRRRYRWVLVIGWLFSGLIFVAVVVFEGGFNQGDRSEVLLPTWAMAHGAFACAYSNPGVIKHVYAAPAYSMITAGLSALLRIGHTIPFPTSAELGSECGTSVSAISSWAIRSGAVHSTMLLGYVAPLALLLGMVSVFEGTLFRRTLWEVVALVTIALTPAMFLAFAFFFHPQDVLAMGILLGAIAAASSRRWGLCGVLLGLAFVTQQFALLVGVLFLVLVPRRSRMRLIAGAGSVVAAVSAPLTLLAVPSQRMSVLRTIVFGSDRIMLGANHFVSAGGTIVYAAHLSGDALFLVSRAMPVISVALVAFWARRRFGPQVLEPPLVLSLVGLSLGARLVFEQNLFGYYFLAAAVLLVLVDTTEGRLRVSTLTWLGVQMIVFNTIPALSSQWRIAITTGTAVTVVIYILVSLSKGRIRWGALAFLIFIFVMSLRFVYWSGITFTSIPTWVWQIVLVPWVFFLLADPLRIADPCPSAPPRK